MLGVVGLQAWLIPGKPFPTPRLCWELLFLWVLMQTLKWLKMLKLENVLLGTCVNLE